MPSDHRWITTAISRRSALGLGGALGLLAVVGCSNSSESSSSSSASAAGSGSAASAAGLSLNSSAWKYDSTNDVYHQLGLAYVTRPAAKDYETLGVYVPGKYLTAKKNSDGTYTGKVNPSGTVNGFTASTAPIVFPVNTPGYAAQKPPTSYAYTDVSSYMKAGYVYVAAGLRGKDSNSSSYSGNAPWGVTDLKSAIRYIRYNGGLIPGRKSQIFVFGHSGGGAQSAIAGAAGDAKGYTPYLNALGAAMTDASGKTISDAVAGAMCWCPITNLDYANAAYEWNMGQFSTSGTRASGTWTAAYSKDLAEAWATYLNSLGLKSSGKALKLEKSTSGTYLSGSYYDYLVQVVQTSLNNFLTDTTFPYTPDNQTMAGMGGSGASGGSASGMPSGASGASGMPPGASGMPGASSSASSTTYKTVTAYIAHLNASSTWVTYDSGTNKATVLNLEGFVKSQKSASKDVGAFDGVDRGETENVVMGKGTSGLHFAKVSRDVIKTNQTKYAALTGWKSDYAASEYTSDFAVKDTTGTDVLARGDLYNPMYYLSPTYDGYRSTTIAPHWRIRTGIMQGDTALTTEVDLALALEALKVKSLDFATVWGLGHTMAERKGSAVNNFIAWVKQVTS